MYRPSLQQHWRSRPGSGQGGDDLLMHLYLDEVAASKVDCAYAAEQCKSTKYGPRVVSWDWDFSSWPWRTTGGLLEYLTNCWQLAAAGVRIANTTWAALTFQAFWRQIACVLRRRTATRSLLGNSWAQSSLVSFPDLRHTSTTTHPSHEPP